MTSFQNVLLIGAGGNLGLPVLKEFLNSPYKVSVLTRKESTSKFPEGVLVFKADYTNISSVKAAMEGQDVVISMVAITAIGDQQVFVDAAIAAGVKRFFPSEFGPYTRNAKFAELVPFIFPLKTALVDYLRSKESQISWTGLVTAGFFDWAIETGFFYFDFASKTVTLVDGGSSPFTSNTVSTIAKALVAALDHADETKNQYVFIGSFTASQKDILEVVEKVDGQKWTVKYATSEEVIARGQRAVEAGEFSGIVDLITAGACGKQALGDHSVHGFWNDRLGLATDDMEQVVKNLLQRKTIR
ncbi:isoflavone reductase family protein [Pyrenochaeta sp. DS3sAY3a]|nr:isoflavone reductase family protein [Pyrenochaeta sp. DS3sAY3a]